MMSKIKAVCGSLTVLALALGGCATTSTPYQPVSSANRVAGGYSEVRLAQDRYSVTFVGNTLTSREQVETYLLYRAAELTVQQGFDWFVIQDRQLEHRVEQQYVPDPLYSPRFSSDFAYWRPYWRYYGPIDGWHTWYPYYGDPFWADHIDRRTVERYEATAEIQMGHGAMPAANLKAFDARDVMARLGPGIRPPSQ